MKIYFAGSIRAGRGDQELYLQLIQGLQAYGQVLTEHVGDPNLSEWGDDGPSESWIYERDMAWLALADLVVAEVSTPSLGVGYELGKAESLGKPTLCLYRERESRRLSAMVSGNPKVVVAFYQTLAEAMAHIDKFLTDSSRNRHQEIDDPSG
ncbi:MAG: nucleoside 2-deoxyribosyltransferase [Chloroflexi bacterium]|nr:nucleoside 2-deoxyribosyltransferase [Chloroflexota bacterium]MDA1220080.1 nucleoside 2-deoxyribosyltransferase [Chloroflexota bacterium]